MSSLNTIKKFETIFNIDLKNISIQHENKNSNVALKRGDAVLVEFEVCRFHWPLSIIEDVVEGVGVIYITKKLRGIIREYQKSLKRFLYHFIVYVTVTDRFK